MAQHRDTSKPMRTKPLLEDFLRECDLTPERTVCFTTNSSMIYNTVKMVEHHLNWHFTKSQNINLFHLQLQQTESQLVKAQDKIDY